MILYPPRPRPLRGLPGDSGFRMPKIALLGIGIAYGDIDSGGASAPKTSSPKAIPNHTQSCLTKVMNNAHIT